MSGSTGNDATPSGDGGARHGPIVAFIQHRVAANLLAIVLCLIGAVALSRMNTQFFPTTEIPTISVSIKWPGASAEEISQGIVDVVEPEVRFLEGIDKVISYAVEGLVRITLEFREGTDMQKALSDAESRIAAITTLPQDAERPVVTRIQLYETVGMVAVSGPFEEGALQEHAKRLRDQLLAARIDRVVITGKREQEIWVETSAAALQQLGLTPRDVADRIAATSQDTPLGNLEGQTERQLRVRGRRSTADGIANLELHALPSGQTVLVRDVAVSKEAFSEEAAQHFRNGNPAIVLNVQRAVSGDTLRSMRVMLETVDQFKRASPPSLGVEPFDIRSKVVDQRIRMLTTNAIQGFVLVVLVLLVFLDMRTSLWVAAGVPVALLATFAFMKFSGQTINAVSLVALILVLGIIVDDAIVVGEETITRAERGLPPETAATEAAQRMALPILASTLTTQAAFLPMLLITGVIGQILAAIPMVVVVALAASLVECFFVLPTHMKHALESRRASRSRPVSRIAAVGNALRSGFDRNFMRFRDGPFRALVQLAYDWRYVTLATAVAALIFSFGVIAGGRVGFTFFPVPEPEIVYANVTFAPGLSEPHMRDALGRIEAATKAVDRRLTGEGGKSLLVMTHATLGAQDLNRGRNLGRVEIELTPGEDRTVRTRAFIAAWQRAVPPIVGVDVISVLGRRVGPPGSDVDVRLTGASVEVLKEAAQDLRGTLEKYNGLLGLDDDLPYGKAEVVLQLTPRGRALGFTTDLISKQVRGAYQGAVANRFARGDEEVTVRVRIDKATRQGGVAALQTLMLKSPSGPSVQLSEVVDVVEQPAFSVIRRIDGQVAVSVTANVDASITTADQVLASLTAGPLRELERKWGVRTSLEGRAETQRRTFADLRIGTIVALALIYVILVFVLQRWLQPILVMLIIPFGFIGMVLGHWAMGFQMALFSMIGLLGLSGIIVNGSIVLIDRMNERVDSGEDVAVAAVGAACDRLRAVLLTTLTTVGGMSPLLTEKSLQAQFLIPIAITLSFGLAFGTLLLMFLVPAMVGIGRDLTAALRGLFRLVLGVAARDRPAGGTAH